MVYLDNSATTQICEKSKEAMIYTFNHCFGNPSSLHELGILAENCLNDARLLFASQLGCKKEEIIFTSGGTEANNLAVLGAAEAYKRFGNRIVTTAIEHASVREPIRYLEQKGFEVIYLEPDENGAVSLEEFKKAVNGDTILVSIMAVNNETGAVQPISQMAGVLEEIRISAGRAPVFHSDGVQAFGKISCSFMGGVDLFSVSAHKIHGPKGAGVLYIKKGTRVAPIMFGGGQEHGMRPGTESVPLIAGMEAAVRDMPDILSTRTHVKKLRHLLVTKLRQIEGVMLNSPPDGSPYIVNISIPGYRSETVLHYLESREIYLSSGSACAKNKRSHVLTAQGLPVSRVDSALRISFSYDNQEEDVERLLDALKSAVKELRKAKV